MTYQVEKEVTRVERWGRHMPYPLIEYLNFLSFPIEKLR